MSSRRFPLMSCSRRLPLLLAMVLGAAPAVHAINYTWNNTGTDWNAPASWLPASGSGIPNSGGDVAIFNAAALSNPNISSSISISRITANSSSSTGYTLSSTGGAAITLGAATTGTSSAINYTPSSGSFSISAPIILGAAGGSTQTVNVTTGGTVAASGAISSTNSVRLQKSGGGALVISSAANTYTGGTTVSAGTLLLSGAGVLGSGDLTLSGGTFDISGLSTASYSLGASLIGAGTVSGGGKTFSTSGLALSGTLLTDNITLSLAGVSTFEFASAGFAAGTFDLVQGATGSVVLGGTLSLSFAGGAYANGSTVRIFDVANYSGSFSSVNFSGLGAGQSAVFDAATGSVTVVPEPEAWVLFTLGAVTVACALVRNRRRQTV